MRLNSENRICSVKVGLRALTFDKPIGGSGVTEVDVITAHITDSENVTGLGFSYVIGGGAGALVVELCERISDCFLVDKALLSPDHHWWEICRSFNRTGYGPNFIALAALDVGLWDLTARRRNVPLGIVLGGDLEAAPVYASAGFTPQSSPSESAQLAKDYIARGYKGIKPRINVDDRDFDVLRAVRDAIGPDPMLMADANEKGQVETATRLLEQAGDIGLTFVEKPLPAYDPIGFRELGALAKRPPIAAGEHLQGPAQFATAIEDGYLSYIQPDLAFAGGITPCLAVARHAAARGITTAPHFLPGLFVHFSGAFRGKLLLEEFPLIETVFSGWPEIDESGMLKPPNAAGHGLEIRT